MEQKHFFVIVDENDRIIGTEPMGGDFIDSKKTELSKEKIIKIKL
ncbi:hypothetical protein [Peribacillus aracenensis]|nr:hypothetical protein [Peribacillus sp. BBB004]